MAKNEECYKRNAECTTSPLNELWRYLFAEAKSVLSLLRDAGCGTDFELIPAGSGMNLVQDYVKAKIATKCLRNVTCKQEVMFCQLKKSTWASPP